MGSRRIGGPWAEARARAFFEILPRKKTSRLVWPRPWPDPAVAAPFGRDLSVAFTIAAA
ncbi:hypothetical protein HMPREF0731_1008 [Pseudoroseomonas cervicalis ATCC 49957]|uniref:Uncharacterized protein n=1 Tax=Pseudoroseomonas cervicalis ATCC 49957 TaxID=525371 RepID=D5RIU8_9PROT|nr:hypothetical protein HMPREF0731_1008 [Pseudoroseomonas cervicalis ATCC 49957]